MKEETETKLYIESKIKDLELYKVYLKTLYQQDYWQFKLVGRDSGMTLPIKGDFTPVSTEMFIKGYIELIDREIDRLVCEILNKQL